MGGDSIKSLKASLYHLEIYQWSNKLIAHTDNYAGTYRLDDLYDKQPLFGNMKGLLKDQTDQRLQSNHLGAHCLTRPQLCEEGFTVKFQIKGMSPVCWR